MKIKTWYSPSWLIPVLTLFAPYFWQNSTVLLKVSSLNNQNYLLSTILSDFISLSPLPFPYYFSRQPFPSNSRFNAKIPGTSELAPQLEWHWLTKCLFNQETLIPEMYFSQQTSNSSWKICLVFQWLIGQNLNFWSFRGYDMLLPCLGNHHSHSFSPATSVLAFCPHSWALKHQSPRLSLFKICKGKM